MEVYTARLASFKDQRVKFASAKRYVKVSWPHPKTFAATPEMLAEAGFYFAPTFEDRDNAVCFLCEKELSGWEEKDDPFTVHWEKCGDKCAWAVVRCGLGEDIDRKGNFTFSDPARQPASKVMEKARLSTFNANGWWPHDQTKGHGASSGKMAKAGFVYTPQQAGDDTATCFYCHVSLSGWDEDDDPL
ncbi:inhibitor of apoptosis repeat-containing protein [Auriscalpium vulgare]|uniref:Inhibitor of apoptosis repeat-containing protein n=1 Tax=Auriscalpium vulgare TaxID=40419 RepID=A0ACB8SBD4_9AGAM|nr:inhibitor of apoptosis repeat-containing protein [Auriscalpium vulgare]